MEENQINETCESCETCETCNSSEARQNARLPKLAFVSIVLSIIGVMISMFAIGYRLGSRNVDAVAETTVVTEATEITETETTECTTAPVETSIPETEETIPETTEAETVPETTEAEYIDILPESANTSTGTSTTTTPPETTPTPEPTTAPETDETTNPSGMSEVEMLACVIFQEAGADYACDECRRRVADVVLNRVNSPLYPDTIYEVLTQYCQYGRFYWTGIVWSPNASHPANAHAVERAYRIAEEVLNGQHSDIYGDSYIGQAEFPVGYDYIYHCGIYFSRV